MKINNDRSKRLGGTLMWGVIGGVLLLVASGVRADDKTLQVNVGESIVLKAENVAKLAIADPNVADVIPLSDTEVSVIGKGPGITTLTVVHKEAATEMFRLEVVPGASVKSIHDLIGQSGITVREVGNSVVLEGKVKDEEQMERAVKIATAYKGNAVNLLEVTDPRQVRIHERFVEIRSDAVKQLGIEYFGTSGEIQYAMGFGKLESPGSAVTLLGHGFTDPNQTTAQQLSSGSTLLAVEATLHALAERNYAKVLAQPTLVTLSGKEANFLSGGEVPIVQQLAQTFTVEFKEFGVRMKVKPVVDSANRVNTHIMAEVSSVAPNSNIAGIPSFVTRRAETDVQLNDGQTIVISGLLNNEHDRDAIRKVPWLGDLPGIGALFRSKDYQASISELLVFVTPEVVKDIAGDTAKAARTPTMKEWNGHQAEDQFDVPQEAPYPKWQKPLDVDEFKPEVRPSEENKAPAAAPAADSNAAPAAQPDKNFTPARPATP